MQAMRTGRTLVVAGMVFTAWGGGGAGMPLRIAAAQAAGTAATTTAQAAAGPGGPAARRSPGGDDAAAYRALAAVMGQAAGIDYRYGPGPSAYGTTGNGGLPTWPRRADHAFPSDRNGGERPCDPIACGTWQVSAWSNDVGDFSSNVGHVAYIPDQPAQRVGMADLAISSVSNAVFSQRPELMWVYYGAGVDEINALAYRRAGAAVGNPVGVARCLGRPGWCMNRGEMFELIQPEEGRKRPENGGKSTSYGVSGEGGGERLF